MLLGSRGRPRDRLRPVLAALVVTAVTASAPVLAAAPSGTGPGPAPASSTTSVPGCAGARLPGTSAVLPLPLACPTGPLGRSPALCPVAAARVGCGPQGTPSSAYPPSAGREAAPGR